MIIISGENKLKNGLKEFLSDDKKNKDNTEKDCTSGTCILKGDKSLVERINKKIITEDGRQLLL